MLFLLDKLHSLAQHLLHHGLDCEQLLLLHTDLGIAHDIALGVQQQALVDSEAVQSCFGALLCCALLSEHRSSRGNLFLLFWRSQKGCAALSSQWTLRGVPRGRHSACCCCWTPSLGRLWMVLLGQELSLAPGVRLRELSCMQELLRAALQVLLLLLLSPELSLPPVTLQEKVRRGCMSRMTFSS